MKYSTSIEVQSDFEWDSTADHYWYTVNSYPKTIVISKILAIIGVKTKEGCLAVDSASEFPEKGEKLPKMEMGPEMQDITFYQVDICFPPEHKESLYFYTKERAEEVKAFILNAIDEMESE